MSSPLITTTTVSPFLTDSFIKITDEKNAPLTKTHYSTFAEVFTEFVKRKETIDLELSKIRGDVRLTDHDFEKADRNYQGIVACFPVRKTKLGREFIVAQDKKRSADAKLAKQEELSAQFEAEYQNNPKFSVVFNPFNQRLQDSSRLFTFRKNIHGELTFNIMKSCFRNFETLPTTTAPITISWSSPDRGGTSDILYSPRPTHAAMRTKIRYCERHQPLKPASIFEEGIILTTRYGTVFFAIKQGWGPYHIPIVYDKFKNNVKETKDYIHHLKVRVKPFGLKCLENVDDLTQQTPLCDFIKCVKQIEARWADTKETIDEFLQFSKPLRDMIINYFDYTEISSQNDLPDTGFFWNAADDWKYRDHNPPGSERLYKEITGY